MFCAKCTFHLSNNALSCHSHHNNTMYSIHNIEHNHSQFHSFRFRMSTNQKPENKVTFNLERAEEDDEFEEFEKDGCFTCGS